MESRRHGRIGVLAIVILPCLVVSLLVDLSLASEMGFRFNKGLCPQMTPFPRGRNWVSLPAMNSYATSADLCLAFGIPAGGGRILQWNADLGFVRVYNCGSAGPFTLTPFVGVELNVLAAGAGVLEGTHIDPPAPGIPLFPVDGPPFNGLNLYPVPYHSMAATMQDVCVDIGLPAGPARIVRIDACTGVLSTWNCGPGLSPPIFLGEAVMIDSMPVGVAFVPDHF